MGRRKSKKKSPWSAYNPTDAAVDAIDGGAPGGPAFFHYHPGSSGMNQSWWFNTFGKQQDPVPEGEEDPATSASSENKNEAWNEFPLEPRSYDSKYREYRPPQRSSSPTFLPRPTRSRTATPPPPQSPSPEYIATSDDPSHSLTDPISSRKLLVLDLNGTLLHRSPRASKNAPRYPIPGQGGFQPRLRSVHPRPYLPSFKSYIFHPSNKEWLDVMVWSSAQPHSVNDMVEKCFRDEKRHFVAVWARDTLGLPQHLYTRKVQTVKDLNIPWSKLFTPADPSGERSPHTAMSTLLMDDSARKAELQPYNHLLVKEYSNVIRNRDLVSLLEERDRPKPPPHPPEEPKQHPLPPPPPPPQLPLGIPHPLISPTVRHQQPVAFDLPPTPLDPSSDFQFDQSVGIQPGATLLNPLVPFPNTTSGYTQLSGDSGLGHGVIAPQMLFKNPSPSVIGYQNPQPFQQFSQSASPFTPSQQPQHSQPPPHIPATERQAQLTPSTHGNPLPSIETTTEEAGSTSEPPTSTSTTKKRKRKGGGEAEPMSSRAGPILEVKYDETLLAIVGILDEVKSQSNVASWVKANGLWGPYLLRGMVDTNIGKLRHGHFRDGREDSAASSDSGSADSGRHRERKKKRGDVVSDVLEHSLADKSGDGGSPCAGPDEKRDQVNESETPPWFDHPPTVRYWVERGRNALKALEIPVEHGLKQ